MPHFILTIKTASQTFQLFRRTCVFLLSFNGKIWYCCQCAS